MSTTTLPRATIAPVPDAARAAAVPPGEPHRRAGVHTWAVLTLALVFGLLAARLIYLAWLCPYTLIEDEAHYWEWSRRLDWSYYTKGPGIALAIRAATDLLGNTEFGVRSVAAVSAAITTGAVAMLGWAVVRRSTPHHNDRAYAWRIAFFAAASVQLAPVMQMLGVLSTIDGPYLACWSVAALAGWYALTRGSLRAWCALGLALGLGFVFKYTTLMLVPGLAAFAITARDRLAPARRTIPGAGLAFAIATLGFIPVVVWNAGNDWGTVRHLLGHLGVRGGDMPVASPGAAGGGGTGGSGGFSLLWPLEFIGTQAGMVGPGLVLAAMGLLSIRREASPQRRDAKLYLVAIGLPLLAMYFALSFVTEVEGNWPVAAYVTLLTLAGWTAADAMTEYRRRVDAWLAIEPDEHGRRPWLGRIRAKPETYGQVLWHVTIGFGLVSGLGMLRMDAIGGVPMVGQAVPLGRFTGADVLAASAAEHAADLQRDTGRPAFFMSQHYGRASQLAFYLPHDGPPGTRPEIVCTSSRMGGRTTQYDKWADSSPDRPELLGRPAVLLGATREQWQGWFERVEPIEGGLRGESKKSRAAFLGWGYLGDPARRATP